jgi:acyl-CoA dehydrogenase
VADRSYLQWPFFDDSHRDLAKKIDDWCMRELEPLLERDGHGEDDANAAARRFVKLFGDAGWLRYTVPAAYGGALPSLDVRSIALIRETVGRFSGLAEFSFAMQGLGCGPITFSGSEELKKKYLPAVSTGEKIAAFAISEAEAGSDVAAMQATAKKDGDGYVINGEKTWISNAGIAHFYVVICRYPEGGERSYIALVVDSDNPGLDASEQIRVIAPHPLGKVKLKNCRVLSSALVGKEGKGLSVALGTLDIFRTTVGAAANGFARRALDEAIAHTKGRKQFGKPLADFQLTQAKIAEMATAIDAAALLIYRSAWVKDVQSARVTREAAMAKLVGTESAQQVIDSAVQLLGGKGVVSGAAVERLYREIRALRIYEGTSEIQKLIIAAQVLEEKS